MSRFRCGIMGSGLPAVALVVVCVLSGCNNEGPVAETVHGPVQGFTDQSETWVWKAVPFARPPVGALRWKAPRDPEPWEAVRAETEFGNGCTQYFVVGDRMYGDEDCLYLNVWRPQTLETGLPVYVWIHGGGNSIGTASLPDYNGANLAGRKNLVVVTTNYRLGPLGWFTHPALRSGAPGAERDDSGNYGTLDLVKALEWVRDNIEAFGGDPGNVTVGGESAGALNALTLLMAPPAEGLLHRAVVESGGTWASPVADGEASARRILVRLLVRDGVAPDEEAAEAYLDGMSEAEIESYLRAKSDREILACTDVRFAGMLDYPDAYRDGVVLPASGFEALRSGDYPNKVPVLIGSNKEEKKLFIVTDPLFQGRDDLYQVVGTYGSDAWKAEGVDQVARDLTAHPDQPAVYAYQFLWGAVGEAGRSPIPEPWGFKLGSFHTLEIPFFFGNEQLNVVMQALVFNEANRPGREALSEAMMTYLARFARTGDPNAPGEGLPRWAPWSNETGAEKCILLDVDEQQELDIRMSSVELTEAGVRERMAREVPEPLYTEAREYLGW